MLMNKLRTVDQNGYYLYLLVVDKNGYALFLHLHITQNFEPLPPAPAPHKEEISGDAWQLAAFLSRAISLFTKELSNQELYPESPSVTHSNVP
jgi:hypothetical protein